MDQLSSYAQRDSCHCKTMGQNKMLARQSPTSPPNLCRTSCSLHFHYCSLICSESQSQSISAPACPSFVMTWFPIHSAIYSLPSSVTESREDSESPVRQPGVAFLNKNMHNSATEELFLETDDEELRLSITSLVLCYQITTMIISKKQMLDQAQQGCD